MQTRSIRWFTLLCLLLMLSPIAKEQGQQTRRDGNWWIGQSKPIRIGYVVGFIDGIGLGYDFSIMGTNGLGSGTDEANKPVASSFLHNYKRYFGNVSSGQISDGLDQFYSDFKNRGIEASDGVWLILNEIAGTKASTMDDLIQYYRQKSSNQ